MKPETMRKAKRKAAEEEIIDGADENSLLASLDLSNSKTGPKIIANALLTLLPETATRQNPIAQKLTKAFPLVISELESRANILARASESHGTRQPIAFRFPLEGKRSRSGDEVSQDESSWATISLPEDSFVNVMNFLNGRENVKCSEVNKAWLAASRQPILWQCLDESCGLTNASKKLNMTALLNILRRPMFADLKHFMLPSSVKLSAKSIKQMSQICPHLQSFSLGYDTHFTGAKPKDADLIAVAENFPKLNTIHTHMWSITNYGIVSVAKILESNLIDLRIRGDPITNHYLGDAALRRIAKSCCNLRHFAYKLDSFYYNEAFDGLSGEGILALVSDCRCLEVLELSKARRIGRETFEEIIQMLALANESRAMANAVASDDDDDAKFALRNITLMGYPFVVTGWPLRISEINVECGTILNG